MRRGGNLKFLQRFRGKARYRGTSRHARIQIAKTIARTKLSRCHQPQILYQPRFANSTRPHKRGCLSIGCAVKERLTVNLPPKKLLRRGKVHDIKEEHCIGTPWLWNYRYCTLLRRYRGLLTLWNGWRAGRREWRTMTGSGRSLLRSRNSLRN